jgi:hypothetical protein
MKRLSAFIIIVLSFYGCRSKIDGKLIIHQPSILLGKEYSPKEFGYQYNFDFYVENTIYVVSVSKEMYNAYKVGDTLHGYQVIPH